MNTVNMRIDEWMNEWVNEWCNLRIEEVTANLSSNYIIRLLSFSYAMNWLTSAWTIQGQCSFSFISWKGHSWAGAPFLSIVSTRERSEKDNCTDGIFFARLAWLDQFAFIFFSSTKDQIKAYDYSWWSFSNRSRILPMTKIRSLYTRIKSYIQTEGFICSSHSWLLLISPSESLSTVFIWSHTHNLIAHWIHLVDEFSHT